MGGIILTDCFLLGFGLYAFSDGGNVQMGRWAICKGFMLSLVAFWLLLKKWKGGGVRVN
jgi:hypothetical protein